MSIRSTGRTGAVALDAGLTPPFEKRNLQQGRKAGDIKREPERRNFGTGEEGTETSTVTVIGQSVLERQAAVLSK